MYDSYHFFLVAQEGRDLPCRLYLQVLLLHLIFPVDLVLLSYPSLPLRLGSLVCLVDPHHPLDLQSNKYKTSHVSLPAYGLPLNFNQCAGDDMVAYPLRSRTSHYI